MQGKKKRNQNWSDEEKEILRRLVSQSADILENKRNSTSVNIEKKEQWKNVAHRLSEITKKKRSETEVKLAWKRMKLSAKANISIYHQLLTKTKGDVKPPSPSSEDEAVMAIVSNTYIHEQDVFDSDSPQDVQNNNPNSTNNSQNGETVYVNEESTVKAKEEMDEMEFSNVRRNSIDIKTRQLEMLEEMHKFNIKLAQLKIKKLQLEIAQLQKLDRQYFNVL